MKTNLRYVGKQLGIVLLLAVIGIIINPWSILSPDTWSEIIGKLTGK